MHGAELLDGKDETSIHTNGRTHDGMRANFIGPDLGPNPAAVKSEVTLDTRPAEGLADNDDSYVDRAKKDLDSCHAYRVESLPGSHKFGSEFIVAIAGDPDPAAKESDVVWGLTADLSDTIPSQDRAMYLSKSVNGGVTWTQVARLDSRYFDAKIGEGLRNELSVSPGGTDFVITTQKGAFQVFPGSGTSDAMVRAIAGPRVPRPRPRLTRPKRPGDPIMAGVVRMTADGKHMMIGYGYFDLNPRIFTYHKDEAGHGSKISLFLIFRAIWISCPWSLMTRRLRVQPHSISGPETRPIDSICRR